MGADLAWERVDSGYHVTNGPAFSRDGQVMYHTDSALQTVYAFNLAADGSLGERRVHLTFGEGDGYPDGMTVDAEDCLWIAFWDGWCLRRFAPSGDLLATIAVPVQRPTSVAFGGAGLDELFVTSAARDLTPEELERQPKAGGLFRLKPGVPGIAELPFAG
jgi:sugar lactone lactonase YvrE